MSLSLYLSLPVLPQGCSHIGESEVGPVTFPYLLTQSWCLGLQFCGHRQPSSFLIMEAGRVTGRDLEHLTCGRGCNQHGKEAGKDRLAVGDVCALGNFTLSHHGTPMWVTRHTKSMGLRTARPEWELDLGSVLESEVSSSWDIRYLVPSSDLSFPNHREPHHLLLTLCCGVQIELPPSPSLLNPAFPFRVPASIHLACFQVQVLARESLVTLLLSLFWFLSTFNKEGPSPQH